MGASPCQAASSSRTRGRHSRTRDCCGATRPTRQTSTRSSEVVTSASHSWGFMFRRGRQLGPPLRGAHVGAARPSGAGSSTTRASSSGSQPASATRPPGRRLDRCHDRGQRCGDRGRQSIAGTRIPTPAARRIRSANWGTPDCTVVANPSVAADDGLEPRHPLLHRAHSVGPSRRTPGRPATSGAAASAATRSSSPRSSATTAANPQPVTSTAPTPCAATA